MSPTDCPGNLRPGDRRDYLCVTTPLPLNPIFEPKDDVLRFLKSLFLPFLGLNFRLMVSIGIKYFNQASTKGKIMGHMKKIALYTTNPHISSMLSPDKGGTNLVLGPRGFRKERKCSGPGG